MRLILVSGLSGSGKSVALHMLEDLDFYCVDNIPAALLKGLVSHIVRSSEALYQRTAVGLDARNTRPEIATVPALLQDLRTSGLDCELLFLTAGDDALLRRFAETRRKHPLSRGREGLREAIALERDLLEPVVQAADLVIDTSTLGVHDLRETIRMRVERLAQSRMSILFESFGYKAGIPGDADFVFDVRVLPNPYYDRELRPLTGLDEPVREYVESGTQAGEFYGRLLPLLEFLVPAYVAEGKSHLTLAIGCTGGRHRSVTVADRIRRDLEGRDDVVVRVKHRDAELE